MKKIILIILIGFIINSCDNNDCCSLVSTQIDIKYTDIDRNSILGIDGGIDTSNIVIFYKEHDEWKEYYRENLDFPKGYFIFDEKGENYLRLFPSDYYFGDDISETKIQFSDVEFDIIKCQFKIGDNSIICTKVWYNDQLKWQDDGNNDRIIEIIK